MNLKLRNPLAVFDLETTGIDVTKDRIVEICIVKVMPSGEKEIRTERVNPTVPIPLETSLIHGIYDEDIKDKPTFKQIARTLAQMLEGADLCGFNILRFDLPMLVEEFLRAGVEFNASKRKIVDAQRIFHLMEPRDLSAAYRFFCKKELENAHSAEADTLATFDVLDAQIEHYKGRIMKDKEGNQYEPVKNDIISLHQLTVSENVDFAGRMIYKNGIPFFNFGKYKNEPVLEVLKKNPSYFDWMMQGDFALETKQKLTEIKLSTMKR